MSRWTIVGPLLAILYLTIFISTLLDFFLQSFKKLRMTLFLSLLQTIEQGVGQTFADQTVVNFDQYGQREVLPGSINPIKIPSGQICSRILS